MYPLQGIIRFIHSRSKGGIIHIHAQFWRDLGVILAGFMIYGGFLA
jgi:hypothetical protein